MKLVFKGHESAREKLVSAAECKSQCDGNTRGCFKQSSEYKTENNVLTIQFTCVTWLNSMLDGKDLHDVRVHEKRHQQDFLELARKLKTSLEKAVDKGRDPDIESRMSWFDYDVCVKNAAFHRQVGAMVEICFPPAGVRPPN
jgi:hypothetical protein